LVSAEEKFEKYRPKKFLGQNFLVDKNISRKIVSAAEISPDDYVIEIGPGQGILTELLYNQTKNLTAVELDKTIYENLNRQFGERINLIHKDFLELDLEKIFSEVKKIKVIGNIPYNITTEILFKLFESEKIDTAVIMMQKEVAERLTAKPNTKEYGILSVRTQIISKPKILFSVSPAVFFPQPKVKSSVVKFIFNQGRNEIVNSELLKQLVRESFGKRRKTMRNSLKEFFEGRKIDPAIIDFDFSRRAESLSVEEFAGLAKAIKSAGKTV